jgi:hypothetical protein
MLFPWFSSKVQASNGDIRPAELVYVIIHSTINGFKFVMCEGLLLADLGRSASIAVCRGEKVTDCHDSPDSTRSGIHDSTFKLAAPNTSQFCCANRKGNDLFHCTTYRTYVHTVVGT